MKNIKVKYMLVQCEIGMQKPFKDVFEIDL